MLVSRDEDPIGEWKIRVSDQQSENQHGSFLGWSMSLWGAAIDPSQVKEFVLPLVQNLLPSEHNEQHEDHPAVSSSTAIAATSTKTHPKPQVDSIGVLEFCFGIKGIIELICRGQRVSSFI